MCRRSHIGQIGIHRFFCSDCYVEFEVDAEHVLKIYDIMDDGTLKMRELHSALKAE